MPRITPELPPFIAPLVGKLVILAMYGGIGLVLGSIRLIVIESVEPV